MRRCLPNAEVFTQCGFEVFTQCGGVYPMRRYVPNAEVLYIPNVVHVADLAYVHVYGSDVVILARFPPLICMAQE